MPQSILLYMKILALIPTRGGSKGLQGKNIRPLNGIPMLAYTIKAAQLCPEINEVIVSTENDAIEEVAKEYQARVFRHPPELSLDGKATFPVIKHVAEALKNQGENYDVIVTMRATSPLRKAEDVSAAIALLMQTGAESVVSVVADETGHPIRLKYIDTDGRISSLQEGEEDSPIPRQKLPVVYKRNGAIYATKTTTILNGSLFGSDSRGFIMPKRRSINVNDEDDFLFAEALLRCFPDKL